jgi:hypothetical protein
MKATLTFPKPPPCVTVASHAHTHGEGCGHLAVTHGDHVDYQHDGQLHRLHDGHVDTCPGPKAKPTTGN